MAAALLALKARKGNDYTDTLLSGYCRPWPDDARHAAHAPVKLDRKNLIAQVIKLLEEPDPRPGDVENAVPWPEQ